MRWNKLSQKSYVSHKYAASYDSHIIIIMPASIRRGHYELMAMSVCPSVPCLTLVEIFDNIRHVHGQREVTTWWLALFNAIQPHDVSIRVY